MERLPKKIEDYLYARDHRLLDDSALRACMRNVLLGIGDNYDDGVVRHRIDWHRIERALEGPFQRPPRLHGEICLGVDVKGQPICSPLQNRNGHTLAVAGTGAGKTNRIKHEILQIAPKVKGTWLFDFQKREFGSLGSEFAQRGLRLSIVDGRSCRWNPLQVPCGVHPADFASRTADTLERTQGLPAGASKLLHATIFRLYDQCGVIAGSEAYPTLYHLADAVARDAQANPQSARAFLASIQPILMSLGPQVLGYHLGWKTSDIAQHHVAFELCGLSEIEKDLFVNTLLLSEFMSRVARGFSNSRMDLFIVCDEAARLISTTSRSLGLTDLIGLVRGTGIGLDLSVQTSDVAPAILSNTANKVIGRCGSARDYDAVGGAMGLTADQRRWMTLNLNPGMFVGQLGEGPWRHPFVFYTPPPTASIPSSAIGGGNGLGDLRQLPVVPASCPGAIPPSGQTLATNVSSAAPALSDAEQRFLEVIVNQPGLPSSAYPALAGMGARRVQALRKALVDGGFIREQCVNTSSRGRSSIVLEPLPSAFDVLGLPQPSVGGTGP